MPFKIGDWVLIKNNKDYADQYPTFENRIGQIYWASSTRCGDSRIKYGVVLRGPGLITLPFIDYHHLRSCASAELAEQAKK